MSSSLSPDQALQKVLRISRLNGWSVALFAGSCTLLTVLLGDWLGMVVGLLVVASGLMEVRGNWMLRLRRATGMRWLIRSQLFLLGVLLVYASARIMTFGGETASENLIGALDQALKQLDLKPDDIKLLVRRVVWVFYGAVMLASCLYQGGLACYYSRRKGLIELSLDSPAPPWIEHQGSDKDQLG